VRRQPGQGDRAEAARFSDSGQVLLLDVREDDEWNSGHAPDAVHRPLGLLSPTPGCIGCGCLSLRRCAIANPSDVAAARRSGVFLRRPLTVADGR